MTAITREYLDAAQATYDADTEWSASGELVPDLIAALRRITEPDEAMVEAVALALGKVNGWSGTGPYGHRDARAALAAIAAELTP